MGILGTLLEKGLEIAKAMLQVIAQATGLPGVALALAIVGAVSGVLFSGESGRGGARPPPTAAAGTGEDPGDDGPAETRTGVANPGTASVPRAGANGRRALARGPARARRVANADAESELEQE